MIQTLAIRLAAVRALTGATTAEKRVYDSAISAIDELIEQEPTPVIVVSIEEEATEVTMTDVLAGTRKAQLVVEIAIASKMTRIVDDGEVDQVVTIPHTDAGLEISISVLCRQAMRALFGMETDWSKVFVAMCGEIDKVSFKRGASAVKDGTKFAARQITFDVRPYAEPKFGGVPEAGTPLKAFMDALAADAETGRLYPLILGAITGAAVPDWRSFYAQAGISDEQADGIGLFPFVLSGSGGPVPAAAIDYGSDLGDITEAAADQFLPPEETPP